MEQRPLPPIVSRQAKIKASARRQVWLQVFLPIGLVLVALTVAGLLLWPSGGAAQSPLADAALVVLIVPALVIGLLVLALAVALVVLLFEARRRLPEPAEQVQLALRQAGRSVRQGADLSVRPLLVLRGLAAVLAGLRSVFRLD